MRPERYFGFRDIAPDTPFDTPFGRRSNLPAILRYKTALNCNNKLDTLR